MNIVEPLNPRKKLPECAEVYFHDGTVMGPMIALSEVGDELAELIVGAFKDLAAQGIDKPTLGAAGAMFCYKAVGTGNFCSLNAPPNRSNYGAQIAYMHQREYAPGGIGVVLINVKTGIITTYGGRGFPEVQECNEFMPTDIHLAQLRALPPCGEEQVAAPKKRAAKKRAGKKKAAKKKAAAKAAKPGDDNVVVH